MSRTHWSDCIDVVFAKFSPPRARIRGIHGALGRVRGWCPILCGVPSCPRRHFCEGVVSYTLCVRGALVSFCCCEGLLSYTLCVWGALVSSSPFLRRGWCPIPITWEPSPRGRGMPSPRGVRRQALCTLRACQAVFLAQMDLMGYEVHAAAFACRAQFAPRERPASVGKYKPNYGLRECLLTGSVY